MYCDKDGHYHCLLIYDSQDGDGLLIESEGASYARYAQYISGAKELVESHLDSEIYVKRRICLKFTMEFVWIFNRHCR